MADLFDKLLGVFYDCEEDVAEPTIHERRAHAMRMKPIRAKAKYAQELQSTVHFLKETYARGEKTVDVLEIINCWAHEEVYFRDMNRDDKVKFITDVCRVLYAQNLIQYMPRINSINANIWFV